MKIIFFCILVLGCVYDDAKGENQFSVTGRDEHGVRATLDDVIRRLTMLETENRRLTDQVASLQRDGGLKDQTLDGLLRDLTGLRQTCTKNASRTKRVAFTATGLSDVNPQQFAVLTHRHVPLNLGRGYDNSTGKFRAPVSGVYSFSASLVGQGQKGVYFGAEIVVGGKESLDVWTSAAGLGDYDAASLGGVVYLHAGDEVWVMARYDGLNFYTGDLANAFSGFLVA